MSGSTFICEKNYGKTLDLGLGIGNLAKRRVVKIWVEFFKVHGYRYR
jgi:hypothetical protein